MSDREEKEKRLKELSKEARKEADGELENELKALLEVTRSDLEKLRPKVSDETSYNKLIAAVEEATQRNESLAELKNRIEKLGTEVVRLGKEAAKLLKYV